MYDFKFADIGEGIHEGVILEWMVKVGDTIEEGETLVVIETDKVNAEIPSPVTGVIKKLGPNVSEVVHVGETLAVIDDGSATTESESKPISEGEEENAAGVVGTIEVSNEVIGASVEHTTALESNNVKVLATPVARKIAKDMGIDIQTVKGSGPNGRVMKSDLYALKETAPSMKEEVKEVERVSVPNMAYNADRTHREKITKMRKTISENMTLSKQVIPHTTVMDEVNVDQLVSFRTTQKEMAKDHNVSLTYMPFIIKALTKTLQDFPIFNSSFDHKNDEIIYKHYMNIGVAVDTNDGLIVPNIKNADQKSIFTIASELSDLKERAANKKITLDDLKDGTISVTNYGVFDSTFGVPVIKYPEVAIIGIGRISKKPVVVDDEISIASLLPLSLSIDHRVIDGGDAGRFLRTFKSYLQNPMLLLMK